MAPADSCAEVQTPQGRAHLGAWLEDLSSGVDVAVAQVPGAFSSWRDGSTGTHSRGSGRGQDSGAVCRNENVQLSTVAEKTKIIVEQLALRTRVQAFPVVQIIQRIHTQFVEGASAAAHLDRRNYQDILQIPSVREKVTAQDLPECHVLNDRDHETMQHCTVAQSVSVVGVLQFQERTEEDNMILQEHTIKRFEA